jgi:hypothetical protein
MTVGVVALVEILLVFNNRGCLFIAFVCVHMIAWFPFFARAYFIIGFRAVDKAYVYK